MRTVANWYLASIIDQCIGLGADKSAILATIPGGQDALADSSMRFSDSVVIDVYEAARFSTGYDEIGLLVGNTINPGTVSILEQASSTSKTLRDAVMLNVKYPGLRQNIGQLDVEDAEDGFRILWNTTYKDPENYRSIVEAVMSRYHMVGQTFLIRAVVEPNEPILKQVRFRHKKPYYSDLYKKVFGCDVVFGADMDMLIAPGHYADLELAVHSPEILSMLFRRLDGEFASLKTSDAMVERMRASIRESIEDGEIHQESVAGRMGMSHRALRRRLTDHKISFRNLVGEERKALCDVYIKDGKPFSTIAQDLGYNDQSAFNRAFKKWHGQTPRDYKRQVMDG